MDWTVIKDWLIPVATFLALVPTMVGVLISLREYRLKLKAEERMVQSATAEMDIRLLQLFTELVYIASGRRGDPVYSKEIVALMEQKNTLTREDLEDPEHIKDKISKAAMIAQTPGIFSADAAFASIATLASRHAVLYEAAEQALESARKYKPELVEEYLNRVRARGRPEV
jgi:hypothetical protein